MPKLELLYPANLKLTGKTCLVVGNDDHALRNIRLLLESGASVKVIYPKVPHEINTLSRMNLLNWKKKAFSSSDLRNIFLVIVASSNKRLNKKISQECNKRNILVYDSADPERSNFINPPTVRRGNLMFTVSTGGQSPTLTAAIKQELETRYGREYARFLKFLGEIKGNIQNKMLDNKIQKELYQKLVRPEILDQKARRNLRKFLGEVKTILNI